MLITGCKNGVKKFLTVEQLQQARKEFGLPEIRTFRLDTSYLHYLFLLDTLRYADQIKNHYQPIQALYYNNSGQLISFHINCYAAIDVPDKNDLNWNQQNAFTSFVPRAVAPVDSILPLSKHLSFIKTFDNKPIDTTGFSAFDYTVIIHWNKKWRPKDSKNLIKLVSDNAELAKDKRINILYVNSDDIL